LELVSYKGKRTVVAGCFSGIGRATVELLLKLGAEVHGLDLKPNEVPMQAFTVTDLRDPASIDAGVAAITGGVDCLFNCAGLAPAHPSLDVMKVNFLGTRHLTDRILTRMRAGGSIVNVASNGGAGWDERLESLKEFVGTASFADGVSWCKARMEALPAAYSLSKEAIIVWTLMASAELIKRGIRLNCTSPGAVQTPMLDEIERTTPAALIDIVAQPIGRRSSAREQAAALLFLNSDAASYLNGVVLPVDGGFHGARIVGNRRARTEHGRVVGDRYE
jgi:NAD(P)-dependent dehydrogenase (short-subunit alcohol dehydrogenase family)